ncbi:MAG: hypothetical protein R6W81_15625 [Bacteroidales bacterium]
MINKYYSLFVVLAILAGSCKGPPSKFSESTGPPDIFPDYKEVVIPVNIAPLNFRSEESPERMRVIIGGNRDGSIIVKGRSKIRIPRGKWKTLLEKNAGESLTITVFTRKERQWSKNAPFKVHIRNNPVDPFIVYRRIAPGYETWSRMGIYQRDITSFYVKTIVDNRLLPGNCMNCHAFNRNDPDQMLFHLRGNVTGTMLVREGEAVKLNTRVQETVSHGVYPYWHPSGKYIAFSVNEISQVFHSRKDKRIEVMDSRSDVVVFDIANNKLLSSPLLSVGESLETFPAFSPDGRFLVFCSAEKGVVPDDYDKIKYSLCKIEFDASSGTFGDRIDTLVSSANTGRSVSFPRISPDGKYLIFTLSDYGNFSIWHKEADFYQLDLATGDFRAAHPINSDNTESYHSWSSDSRWLVFSSRRADGLYTHPYIAFFDDDGNFSKPFLLPQKNPDYYDLSLQSFNVPEFVTGKIRTDGRKMLRAIGSSGKNVIFELKE